MTAMSDLLESQKAMQTTVNKCVQLCVVLCNSLVQQQDMPGADISEMLLLSKAATDEVTPCRFVDRDFIRNPVVVFPGKKGLGE